MRGVVWGLTLDAAVTKLKEIENNYKRYHIAHLVFKMHGKYEYRLEYDNGDIWRAIAARESMLGLRCNISYIDARINKDIVDCIIKPCSIAYPYCASNYFYDFIEEE